MHMNMNCGLHDSSSERDACGIGLVARLDGQSEHRTIIDALTILENLEHRGAVSGDGRTGDGAGLLCRIPDGFFRTEFAGLLPAAQGQDSGADSPDKQLYAIGMFFLPRGISDEKTARSLVEYVSTREGVHLLGWRDVPLVPQVLGDRGAASLPRIRQAAFARPEDLKGGDFERKLFILRKQLESEARTAGFSIDEFSIPSLSARTIVYKGMFVASQFASFYPDLGRQDFQSPFAVVHQRYSTNTFPSWPLAQPFRMIAHNGEINTLRKNVNAMKARQATLASTVLGPDIAKLFPIVDSSGSDSAMFDNVYELLVHGGRSPEHAFLMMVPEAAVGEVPEEQRNFYEYHSALMESWDGPAAMVFTDGLSIGVAADRNGLRPFRYARTSDGRFIGASEAGALKLDQASIQEKGKLGPGKMLMVDLASGKVRNNDAIKNAIFRAAPYGQWLKENRLELDDFPKPVAGQQGDSRADLAQLGSYFGFDEAAARVLAPMLATGKEGIAAMGTRKVPAALSSSPDSFFSYFHQLFAQVTNPPMDSVREGSVMSLECYIGRERNLLDATELHCRQLKLSQPLLTNAELACLKTSQRDDFRVCTVSTVYSLSEAQDATSPAPGSRLRAAIETIRTAVELRVDEGYSLVILSDRGMGQGKVTVPALLALTAVNLHLIETGKRHMTGLVMETGETREIHHVAMLIGYGASAVNPWMVFETLTDELSATNYLEALKHGLLKTMSKMGICSIPSYRGGALYEAVGLAREVTDAFFPGTESRAEGVGLEQIEADILAKHALAYDKASPGDLQAAQTRKPSDELPWPPRLAALLTRASMGNDEDAYGEYATGMTDPGRQAQCLRDIFGLRETTPLPLSSVQAVGDIVARFSIAAMSCGALSPEAHEALATGANAAGAWSNSGEGGEDENRSRPHPDGISRASASRQVASGRFGVTARYLASAGELQIKMAQGAKPGEGGQLPGSKVNAYIAKLRHTKPGTPLISPPPHHDIYSIEDLAQLVHDLRCINPSARIAIKLAAQAGVGAVAAGVAKAGADCVILSSGDGGTGAAPQTSMDYAGGNWEFALPEVRQVLAMNDLSDRVSIQVDGRLRTGRDIVIAAILGAREFAFGTAALIAVGCIACGKCSSDHCPVGITTQNEALRARFPGKPEHVRNFLNLMAEDTRRVLASIGFRNLDELAGRHDLLDYHGRDRSPRDALLDFSKITQALEISKRPPASWSTAAWSEDGEAAGPLLLPPAPAGLPAFLATWRAPFKTPELEREILEQVCAAIAAGESCRITLGISNADRSIGSTLSGELVRRGLDWVDSPPALLSFKGSAGQSFGAFLVPSLCLELIGEANDFVGKGLSGGKIRIRPDPASRFAPENNIIAGNVCLIGATAGKLYLNGRAGERFAIRNSGATAVVEGLGDHGCEYMTGGIVTVLGQVGNNFGAGMSGGMAFILDEEGLVYMRLDHASVAAATIVNPDDQLLVRAEITRHLAETGSPKAKILLDNWDQNAELFVKVVPKESCA
jgi:glutamate synthase domain-containing protein 2/glutamate synthase domain-containing protein 1/glutamate synthase domain-containing protein 3